MLKKVNLLLNSLCTGVNSLLQREKFDDPERNDIRSGVGVNSLNLGVISLFLWTNTLFLGVNSLVWNEFTSKMSGHFSFFFIYLF